MSSSPESAAEACGAPMSPKISIVTPSFQQAAFVEDTLRSVLGQGYPALEYIVMDGGSTDGSADIIRRHAGSLAHWVSERDGGQAQAINRGFARATGDILAYLNSDDLYLPGALAHAASLLDPREPQVLMGNCIQFVEHGVNVYGSDVAAAHGTVDLGLRDYVIQPSTFWTRRAWEATGPFDEALHYVFDWSWFLRASRTSSFLTTPRYLSMYRLHEGHKSGSGAARRSSEIAAVVRENKGEAWGRACEALQARAPALRRLWPLARRARATRAMVPIAIAMLPRDLRGLPWSGLRDLLDMVG
jgi:glycosyltransferase involved in cell wall biosynthesis